ncbi:MAG: acetyl-CoA carboxylase biotin carboxylase subunit [Elusimicrobia bacterium RIFOXYD2_FULL_34_15]|nr:MAG: acetyl-CoA carboxylase biotin carboxylase subunit [Elusimicrobia bacterium RIFOXYD2_FULL_34_15]
MFNKILIANRGEIAVRVIRACREMGIRTVAVHSDVDRECLHVKLADESVCIGPAQPQESYLNIANIISAAEITGADAIHPGYGFLSENTYFADVCESCNIKFIGPSKITIQMMGDKSEAKKTMKKAGVPTIPGTEECITADNPKLFKIAKDIGYPIIVKASSGGGGKGMRIVTSEDSLKNAILTAEAEAKAAFGNGDVYLEKYIEEPKHIEFQILGDMKGDVVSFPERDCSVQRRHQKLIEESPSLISDKLRKKMGHAARLAAKAVKYVTAGTIEFLVDKKGNFYFMEMNTRIQVEHPVTEMVSGIDLLKEQIRLAAGERLGYTYDEIEIKGHVIECRINAEDSENNFIPSPGKIDTLILPGGIGVRVDTHIYAGYTVPSTYDSLIAKLLVMDSTREKAIARMQRALSEFEISGIKTTIPFHKVTMANDFYKKGEVYTNFIQKRIFNEK